MIEFRTLTDDDPDLQYSPLLRAALVTMAYAQEHGAIPLTQTKAFKRVFVHWAVEQINWPNYSLHEMLRYQKVLNESDFAPLEVLRCLLIQLKLARHYKDQFRLTKRGVELAKSPAGLFAELIPFFVLRLDHSSYSRFDERPFGKWDVWLNVINWEADLDLHRFRSGLLRAILAIKETRYGNDTQRRVQAGCSSHRDDQRPDTASGCV